MKKTEFRVAVVLTAAAICGMHSAWETRADERAGAPAEEGFVSLFDGKTLAGWEGDATLWKVENEMIVGDSPGIKQNEFLATQKRYADFELRLEFRLRNGTGNTGVQFRSRRVEGSSEVSGYQADIGEKYWGCLYDESRRNRVLMQAPDGLDKLLHKDDWNQYVIRAQGERISLSLNGVQTVAYCEADAAIAREGIIALQVHSGGPLRVDFRRLRIRELAEKQQMADVESYEQAIEFLFSRVNYERLSGLQYTGDDFKLDRMRELLRRLGDPQETIPAVHIAGTKGKGSTAALTAQILSAAGFRPGLFTSPHISAFEERMAVAGVNPARRELVELVRLVAGVVTDLDKTPGQMSPTYFEIATALAWLYFRERRAEIAVLEVGMGGRLDSTNLCRPAVTIITSISRDHVRQLGSRLDQIAREKAGIVKPLVPVVSGVTNDPARGVIVETCRVRRAPLYELGRDFNYRYHPAKLQPGENADNVAANDGGRSTEYDSASTADISTPGKQWQNLKLPLVGEHQARNLALAAVAIERLQEQGWQIPDAAVGEGLASFRWPGRIEVLSRRPTVIVDAAHNWEATAALLRTLDESFPARRRVLVFAATRDKDVVGMLRQLLPRFDTVVVTCFQNNPRHVPVEVLVRMVRSLTEQPLHWAADAAAAWKLARRFASAADLICVTGSFFIAAEMRELLVDGATRGSPGNLPAAGRPDGSSSARNLPAALFP